MTSSLDPVRITWESGLCRCGCGESVSRPENQFVNGHGGKLLDILVDAYRAGLPVYVFMPDVEDPTRYEPRSWAEQSFTVRGVAWFDWLVSHREGERPSAADIDRVVSALPDNSVEEVLTVPRPITPGSILDPFAAQRAARDPGLDDDLATVREIVGRAAGSSGEGDPAPAVARLEERLARLQDTVAEQGRQLLDAARERDAILDEVERDAADAVDDVLRQKEELAAELLTVHTQLDEAARDTVAAQHRSRALSEELAAAYARLDEAVRPITVSAADLGDLSAPMVLAAARQRALATAQVLKKARYDGDADEVADLAQVFRGDFIQAPRVAAARVFLGGAEQG